MVSLRALVYDPKFPAPLDPGDTLDPLMIRNHSDLIHSDQDDQDARDDQEEFGTFFMSKCLKLNGLNCMGI